MVSLNPSVKPRILLVEDNVALAFGMRINLEFEGYETTVIDDGAVALREVAASEPDIVLLDLSLPTIDGYEVLRTLRRRGSQVPIIVVSARVEEVDRLAALRMGADDFVSKPFSLLELIERVKIQLKRTHAISKPRTPTTLNLGDATIHLAARTVTRGSVEVPLRRKEFDLLTCLLEADGGIVDKQELLQRVWGFKCDVETRTVDFHVATLREKIEEDPSSPRHLMTVRGVGYRLIR